MKLKKHQPEIPAQEIVQYSDLEPGNVFTWYDNYAPKDARAFKTLNSHTWIHNPSGYIGPRISSPTDPNRRVILFPDATLDEGRPVGGTPS